MRRSAIILFFLLITATVSTVQSQGSCPAIVQAALESSADHCTGLDNNQACYGNGDIEAEIRGENVDVHFAAPGDMVGLTDVETLALSALNEDESVWGVAMLGVRANLPNTLPGQFIRMLMFGDTQIENATPYFEPLPVYANSNTRLRSTPSSANDFNIVGGVQSGAELIANGRTANGEWLRVDVNGAKGWIAAIVVDGDSERMTLPVVEAGSDAYEQMQAFYFNSGIGDSSCAEAPDSGLLIQTPEGMGQVEFLINGVSIRLGSTAYIQSGDGNLRVSLLEGQGSVSAVGLRQFLPPGAYVETPLTEDGRAPSGEPSFPQPYDAESLAALPLDMASSNDPNATVFEPIEVADPAPAEEVGSIIAATYAPNGVVPGWYNISVISFTQTKPDTYGDGYCFSGGTVLQWFNLEDGDPFASITVNNPSDITIESITEFTFRSGYEDERTGCEVVHRAVWSPNGPA